MKNLLRKLFGATPPSADIAGIVEILNRRNVRTADRLNLIREYVGLSARTRGRPALGDTAAETVQLRKNNQSARNRRRYDNLKLQGRCVICAKPNPRAPKSRCAECAPRRRRSE